MNRIVTAPLTGALFGALEGAVLIGNLTLQNVGWSRFLGNSETTMTGLIVGLFLGGIAGAIVGLTVALIGARGPLGLLVGALAGLLMAALLLIAGRPEGYSVMALCGSSMACLGLIGLLSADLTSPPGLKITVNRLVTAPLVGLILGALQASIVFTALTIIDVRAGAPSGMRNELIVVGSILGMIFGGVSGGIIGLVVALLKARGLLGLGIGILAGGTITILLISSSTSSDDIIRMLALIALPWGASVGFLTAVLTHLRQNQTAST